MSYMPYTTNPKLPRLRMEAARRVLRDGWSARQAARYTGYDHSTIVRWVAKARHSNRRTIPTESSRPHVHPRQLPDEIASRILQLRMERHQCAEILHHRLGKEGVTVSLSSVKRVLKRHGMSKFSKWKKWHQYPPRPIPEKPGFLVQIDTIMDGAAADRLSAYALIDLCSRWAYAAPTLRVNTHSSLTFIIQAQQTAPFPFQTLQSDHGSEFSKWFTKRMIEQGMTHRHSRVRTPSDNGHVERFIRTVQDECLNRIPRSLHSWQKEIPEFIRYYNTERPHMALGMKTPLEALKVVRSY